MKGTRLTAAARTIGTAAMVVVLLAGCGDDASDDASSDPAPAVELPSEAREAYEAYGQTLLDADGDAMLEYVTDDFTWLSYGTNLMEADFRADYVTENYGGFGVEETGETTVVGGGDEYIFATPERATTPGIVDGISLVKMVNVDGEWLVEAHRWLGEGQGSA